MLRVPPYHRLYLLFGRTAGGAPLHRHFCHCRQRWVAAVDSSAVSATATTTVLGVHGRSNSLPCSLICSSWHDGLQCRPMRPVTHHFGSRSLGVDCQPVTRAGWGGPSPRHFRPCSGVSVQLLILSYCMNSAADTVPRRRPPACRPWVAMIATRQQDYAHCMPLSCSTHFASERTYTRTAARQTRTYSARSAARPCHGPRVRAYRHSTYNVRMPGAWEHASTYCTYAHRSAALTMRRWCSLQEGRRTSASAVQAIVAGLGRQQRAAREISGERGAALLSFFSPVLYSSRAARGSVVKK